MPIPVSETLNSTTPAPALRIRRAARVIRPCSVNLAALLNRLNRLWRSLVWIGTHRAHAVRRTTTRVLAFLAIRLDYGLHLGDQVRDLKVFDENIHLAGLDLGQVEDIVDQAEQVHASLLDLDEVGR